MSFPTLLSSPSVSMDSNSSTHIQIATEFSYTFSNSGVTPPGSNEISPVYERFPNSAITFTTTGSYSPGNTLVTSTPPNLYIGFSGQIYYTEDIATGSVFTYKIPYTPSPPFGTITLGKVFNFSSNFVDDAVIRYIDGAVYTADTAISLTKRSQGNFLINYPTALSYSLYGLYVTNAVGSTTYITYTTNVAHTLFLGQNVTIYELVGYDEANVQGTIASIPTTTSFTINVAGAGTTSISGQSGILLSSENLYSASSISFSANLNWDSPTYEEWSALSSNYSTGYKVLYTPNGLSYESISSSGFYGDCNSPIARLNFDWWWPVSTDLSYWSPSISYTIGDRVNYLNDGVLVVYKSVIDINFNNNPVGNTNYWVVSDTNYPAWSDSTNYSPQDRVIYNGQVYQAVTSIVAGYSGIPGDEGDYNFWKPIASPANPATTFTLTSPNKIVYYPAIFPTLTVSGETSNALLPFLAGSGSDLITFGSAGGFQSMPTETQPLKLTILQSILGVQKASSNFYITVDPFTISVIPTLTSPLSLVTYQPFGTYTYSIPDNLVNVALKYNSNTSTSLVPFITNGETQYSLTFGSTVGLTSAGTTLIRIDAELNGNTVLFSNVTSLITTASLITISPSIPTGSLSLFKFEPFSYLFTITNSDSIGMSFRISRSSPEVIAFTTISEDLQNVTFEGTFLIGYSTTLSLIVDLMYGTTIVDTRTILMTVGQGRFFPPTANQNFQLYRFEDISNTFGSNPSFLTGLPITSIVSAPSLPIGLTFGGSCNTWFLQGTPTLQVNQSNYQIIGSNSSNGRIVTTIISIRVNAQQVSITPNSSTLSGLIVDTAITPITLTALQPPTIYYTSFNYTWSALPDGLTFQDINGSNISQPFTPSDSALTIILAGAPSLSFATYLSTFGSNLYQTRLTGTRTDQTGKQITGSSLFNFSMAETVLINVSNSVTLYRSKPLETTDVLITAGSFFSTATISSVTANSLPPGLTLQLYSAPNIYRLSGTPTTVNLTGSYTFTATNTNGTSRYVTATIPINPNVVTFGGSTPANGSVIRFIVSRPLTNEKTGYYTTPIIFSATSTANATPIIYTSSIDFTTYGLVLNSSTGTLTGIPTTTLSSTTVTISGTDALGTIGTTTIQLSILADTFSWSTYTPTYFQNKAITPFQFVATSTLSERLIQSYSSTDLPTGLMISSGGLLSGTPTTTSSGSFTITASTGFTITNQVYSYSMIADQLMIIQTNATDTISSIFSGIEYRAIQYSSDAFVNATFSIGTLSPATSAIIAVTSGGLVSGDFTTATLNTTYSVTLTAEFGTVTATTTIYILFTTSGSGTINIPTELSTLTFSQPTQTSFTLFEYVPYSILIQAIGSASFIYYFSSAIPLGFEFLKDSSGLTATLSGISPTIANQGIVVYAKTAAGYPVSTSITLRTITPFFINPQMGAGAYTAILRNDVEANAAQNARDNRTFPQVDPLAGPLMAPRAPDVVTPDNCLLNLCKKPCPTCRTMM